MKRKILFMALLCFTLCLVLPTVCGDNKNNDSFATAEAMAEGTFKGNVSTSDMYDYYILTIPANKDLNVTITLTSPGPLTVTGYNSNMRYLYGLDLAVSQNGQKDSDSYWNSGDVAVSVYLLIQGSGNYTMVIKFTNDSANMMEDITTVCFGTMLCIILVPVGIILLIVIIIVIIVWRVKKGRSPPMNNPPPNYMQGQQMGQPQYQQPPQPQMYQQGQTPPSTTMGQPPQ
jgi:hypothetical protein